jgi:hypothetical protein
MVINLRFGFPGGLTSHLVSQATGTSNLGLQSFSMFTSTRTAVSIRFDGMSGNDPWGINNYQETLTEFTAFSYLFDTTSPLFFPRVFSIILLTYFRLFVLCVCRTDLFQSLCEPWELYSDQRRFHGAAV